MKAKLKGKIAKVSRLLTETRIEFSTVGKVDTRLVTAQESALEGVLMIKNIIADQMTIGSTLTITVSDEEEKE